MKLFKSRVVKEGKQYTDLNLSWEYQGKVYLVRVKPCFKQDFELLLATSEPLPEELAYSL